MDRIRFSVALLKPQHWPTWLAMGAWMLAVHLLPFRVQMWLGGWLGRLVAAFSPRRRAVTKRNLALCFPELSDTERRRLYVKTMQSAGRGLFDTGIAWFWPYWRLRRVLDVRGMEHVLEAFDQGQGVLFFTYHFTSLEIGAAAVNRLYPHPNLGVYRPHRNPVFDYVMRKGRERHAHKSRAVPRKDVRTMVRALRQGKLLIYLPDQDYGAKYSTFVPFFGVEAATLTAPTQLVKLGQAKVLSFCATRKADGSGYAVRVYPAIEGYGEVDEQRDARLLNDFLEARIREYPDQYLWAHRRFKSRPDGHPDFYDLERLPSYQRRQRRRLKRRMKKQAAREAAERDGG